MLHLKNFPRIILILLVLNSFVCIYCVCARVFGGVCGAHVEVSNRTVELVLSSHHVGSGNWAQIVMLGTFALMVISLPPTTLYLLIDCYSVILPDLWNHCTSSVHLSVYSSTWLFMKQYDWKTYKAKKKQVKGIWIS